MLKKIFASLVSLITFYSFGYSDLIVGTTGDYAPFSLYNSTTKTFSGKDITLIKDFAKTKNEKIKFVKTTWKTAADDLKAGKFEIFVGGVTITPQRKESFLFSKPLEKFRKAAMAQCKNLSKYKNFKDIDDSKTIIVENRGGTNQNFALRKIKNAKLLIVSDNKQAISSLSKGIDGIYPDIMFTDSVEITYQHSIDSKLCQIPIQIDNNNSYTAFMFNRSSKGKDLMKSFNSWYLARKS